MLSPTLNVTTTALQTVSEYAGEANIGLIASSLVIIGVLLLANSRSSAEVHLHDSNIYLLVNEDDLPETCEYIELIPADDCSDNENSNENENPCTPDDLSENNAYDLSTDLENDSSDDTSSLDTDSVTPVTPPFGRSDRGSDPYWSGFN